MFTSFIEVENSSAIGLHKSITNSIQQQKLDIKNCREQGFDGAAVISWKYSGLHKKIQDVAPHACYVHCDSHNLNSVLNDVMEAITETSQFYDTIESVYNFFGLVLCGEKSFRMSMIVIAQILHQNRLIQLGSLVDMMLSMF